MSPLRGIIWGCAAVLALGCAASQEPVNLGDPDEDEMVVGSDGDPQNGSSDDEDPSPGDGVKLPLPESDTEPRDRDGGSSAMLDQSKCPDTQPPAGEACGATMVCSYGDAQVAGCRTYMVCRSADAEWELSDRRECLPPPTGGCPDDVPSGACDFGAEGSGKGPCAYDDGTYCYCEDTGWLCSQPEQGCPAEAPLLGETCSEQGLGCEYGDPCRDGLTLICRQGYWQPVGFACH